MKACVLFAFLFAWVILGLLTLNGCTSAPTPKPSAQTGFTLPRLFTASPPPPLRCATQTERIRWHCTSGDCSTGDCIELQNRNYAWSTAAVACPIWRDDTHLVLRPVYCLYQFQDASAEGVYRHIYPLNCDATCIP